MKVLVTGASGFIGSHLTESLVRKGYDVRCLVRPTSNLRWLKGLKVELFYGSLEDPFSLRDIIQDVEVVFHVAGVIKSPNASEYFRINAEGTKNLLDAIVRLSPPLRCFVQFSSLAASGPGTDSRPRTESDPCMPITPYGISKLSAEHVVLRYASSYQIPFIIIRPPAVFGPRDMETLYFFKQARQGRIPVIGRGDKYFSLIYVRDLVEGAIRTALSSETLNRVYFLSHPEPMTWSRMAELFSKVYGRPCLLRFFPQSLVYFLATVSELWVSVSGRSAKLDRYKVRELSQRNWLCSPERLIKDSGFSSFTDHLTAFRETAEWYSSRGWL